jgi:hypothetical protein
VKRIDLKSARIRNFRPLFFLMDGVFADVLLQLQMVMWR